MEIALLLVHHLITLTLEQPLQDVCRILECLDV